MSSCAGSGFPSTTYTTSLRQEHIVTNKRVFSVRPACAADVPLLAEAERKKFGNAGTDVYGEDYFRCWLEVNPNGLLVATLNGVIAGYSYTQNVDFEFDRIPTLTTYNDLTDDGFTRRTHRLHGNTIDGVTAISLEEGSVHTIFGEILRQMQAERRKFIISGARISGFAAYCNRLRTDGVDLTGISERDLAIYYAEKCAMLRGGKIWPSFGKADALNIPAPTDPDPVLNKWLRHPGFGIAAVMNKWMKDPESLEYGVLIVLQNPDIP